MLIVFGGLPGTGKTTLSRALAEYLHATYLRIDTIEQALRSSGVRAGEIGPAGYVVGYGLAESNLRLGQIVIADSVNPIARTRDAWRDIATRTGVRLVEIEVICSDVVEHRRRIETRIVDVPGLTPPTWQEVVDRDYDLWDRPHLVLDTARCTPAAALDTLRSWIAEARSSGLIPIRLEIDTRPSSDAD